LSFWIKNDAASTLTSNGLPVQILSDIIIKEKGAWKYHQIVFKNASGYLELAFNTSESYINALSLYPSNAQMTTYTYKPLTGMTSMTDAKGQTTYYEYDDFQRLKTVKDQDGKLVKQYDYHYKQP